MQSRLDISGLRDVGLGDGLGQQSHGCFRRCPLFPFGQPFEPTVHFVGNVGELQRGHGSTPIHEPTIQRYYITFRANQCLEQLAFPPDDSAKRQAIVESVATGLTEPLAGGLFAAARETQALTQRKFRTIWDAVAWLKVHHPKIDLDKPYTPRR